MATAVGRRGKAFCFRDRFDRSIVRTFSFLFVRFFFFLYIRSFRNTRNGCGRGQSRGSSDRRPSSRPLGRSDSVIF